MNTEEILDLFGRRGVLPTPQRLEVAAILLERPQHLSADQIIDRLRQNGSSVSKATVYNTLNLFGERGIAREIMVDPVRKIYDSTRDHHYHYYNVDTGQLTDIAPDSVTLSRQPELPSGTEQLGVDIVIRVKNRRN